MIPQYVYCIAFNSAGRVTDDEDNITGTLAIDDGAHAALTNNMATQIGNGLYRFALTDAERTGARFQFDFASETSGVQVVPANGIFAKTVGFTSSALNELSAIEIVLESPYNSKTKTLELVQRCDYTATSLVGQVKIRLDETNAVEGETVWFGAAFKHHRIASTGTVVSESGVLYGAFSIPRSDTDVPDSDDWKWGIKHLNGSNERSPLLSDQKMKVLPSYAEGS